ncbi:MAG: rhamnogalacturonan lyase [Prevotella sp.]|nr:rhamnogalacturonan lyase [Prevotella sp.]
MDKNIKAIVLGAALLLAGHAVAQEKLNRGLVALKAPTGTGNFVSWRFLATDDEDSTRFDLLRNGTCIASDLYQTNYTDSRGSNSATYQVVTKTGSLPADTTEVVETWSSVFRQMTLDRPPTGPNGGTYEPNDCSVGDVDGDGQYEIIVKWYPSNAKDNSQSGITDNTIIDCYKLITPELVDFLYFIDCRLLWRIDLGPNIRSGAHYTQFMVYDFDGDGRAEMMCKTGPGSKDGKGQYVNAAATDATIKSVSGTALYRSDAGRITGGQEWLTVFDGLTGEAIHTIFYNPNRNMAYGGAADGSVNWGVGKNDTGSYGNRGERFLAAVAHLDGADQNASAIFCRGYYDYAFLWAVDFDGSQLHQRWLSRNKAQNSYDVVTYGRDGNNTLKTFSGCKPTSGSGSGTMYQNGNHNLSVADVDGDGRDEIVWGSATCDDDGTVLFGTGYGHGDAIHLADHCPDRPGLEVFQIHEGGSFGWDLHDARTGEILLSATSSGDNGRGMAGQFDANVRGSLFWSAADGNARSAVTGKVVSSNKGSQNFRIYWDGDLQEELLDGSVVDKWTGNGTTRLVSFGSYGPSSTCNGSKNTPCLQADILGDWREEVILHNGKDAIAIYTTNTPTAYRMPTLMHDRTYRMGICWQNTAYNQPPHLGYYLPDAMLPRITSGERELTLSVNQEMTAQTYTTRYAKSIAQKNYRLADGTAKDGLPEGMTQTVSEDGKSITLNGTPTVEGDYEILLNMTGLGGEKVTDTLKVHVGNETSGIAEQPQSVAQPSSFAVYDVMGRHVPRQNAGNQRRGLYIIRTEGRVRKELR